MRQRVEGCLNQDENHRYLTCGDGPQSRHGLLPRPGLSTNAYGLAFRAEHGGIASETMTNPNTPSAARQGGSTSPPRLLRRVTTGSRGSRKPQGWPASHGALISGARYDFQPGAAHLCTNLRLLLWPQLD